MGYQKGTDFQMDLAAIKTIYVPTLASFVKIVSNSDTACLCLSCKEFRNLLPDRNDCQTIFSRYLILQVDGNEEFSPFSHVFCGGDSTLVGCIGSRSTQNHSKFPTKSVFFPNLLRNISRPDRNLKIILSMHVIFS